MKYPLQQVAKPNEQNQVDRLYVSQNGFEPGTQKNILTCVDIASRYNDARVSKAKKMSEVTFVLGVIYKKRRAFKCPKAFQCDSPSLKVMQRIWIDKQNADI